MTEKSENEFNFLIRSLNKNGIKITEENEEYFRYEKEYSTEQIVYLSENDEEYLEVIINEKRYSIINAVEYIYQNAFVSAQMKLF